MIRNTNINIKIKMKKIKDNVFEFIFLDYKKNKIILEKSKVNEKRYRLPFLFNRENQKLELNQQIVNLLHEKYAINFELKNLIFLGKIQREKEDKSLFLISMNNDFFEKEYKNILVCNFNEVSASPDILDDYLKWLLLMIQHEKINNIEITLKYIPDY